MIQKNNFPDIGNSFHFINKANPSNERRNIVTENTITGTRLVSFNINLLLKNLD